MPRYKVGYNSLGLFAGPAPATGYHFVDVFGTFNDGNSTVTNINLINSLQRIQEVSYDISAPRSEIKTLSKLGSLSRPFIEKPTVNLSFNYVQAGVMNEAKLGFYVNYNTVEGTPIFPNTSGVFLFNGFYNRELTHSNTQIGYPYSYRDCRNMFLCVSTREGYDFKRTGYDQSYDQMNVIGFGNCYIDSYKARASVGDFPLASVNYTCENLAYYASGSGFVNPALNTKTYDPINLHCVIPNNFQVETVSVLKPGDITVDIKSWNKTSNVHAVYGTGTNSTVSNASVENLGLDFSNLEVSSYDISVDFKRNPIKALNYRLPIDRKINFPIYANLNFSITTNGYQSGSLDQLVNKDDDYYVKISMNNPGCGVTGIGIQYEFKKAKFTTANHQQQVQGFSQAYLSFQTEIDPSDLGKGMFMQGSLNYLPQVESGYLIQEEGGYILTEEGDKILIYNGKPQAF